TEMGCHFSVWGVLAFLSLALIVSLTLNISHYLKKKRAKMHKDYEENNPSSPGSFSTDSTIQSESFMRKKKYRQLKSMIWLGKQRSKGKIQKTYILSWNQMCYASLDHSVKGKRRKPRRKKDPS
ncbi:TRAT1 protein, partial [Furnarius figulus]|nr:TRAT1 protein [Furnarius figulus]